MRKLSWLLLAAFFFLNPGFACGPMEPEFTYGAAELRATIEGDWAVTITPTGGAPTEYQLTLKQATSAPSAARVPTRSLVRAAHACNDRTLVASANACVSATIMPLTVTPAQGGPAMSGTPKGTFRVDSLNFTQGDLLLDIGDLHVNATISADRSVLGTPSLYGTGGSAGTVTVRHLP